MKTVIHNGLTCFFDSALHTYTIKETGQVLTSATTLIEKYTPPFDAPLVAQRMIDEKKSKYTGMTLEEIIESWENKATSASLDGTLLHAYAEQWPETKGFGFHPQTPRALDMCKQVDKLFPKLLKRFRVVEAEKIIFSAKLGIAGTVDLLMADDATEELILIDWKTNSKQLSDENNAFGYMLEPLNLLKNCDIIKYSLQLEIYCKILKEENYYPEAKGFRKALIHIQPGMSKVVKVINYPDEVEKLLTI